MVHAVPLLILSPALFAFTPRLHAQGGPLFAGELHGVIFTQGAVFGQGMELSNAIDLVAGNRRLPPRS